MARIRTIKPEFPLSESIGRVSREARLLFIQLWTICDDAGRARAHSRILASLLYPFDDDAPDLIDGWVTELEAQECVFRYEIGGTTYIQVCNWLNHQKIDRPSESKIPAPIESSRALASPREPSMQDLGPRTLDLGPRNTPPTPPRGGDEPTRFGEFWEAYPRKKGSKQKAEAKWKSRKLDLIADRIIEDIRKRVEVEWLERQYIPYPETYLNGSHWESEIEDNRPKPGDRSEIAIPDGTDMEAWSELGRIAMRICMPSEDVERMRKLPIAQAKELLRSRIGHPGGDAGSKGFRLIQGGVAA